LDLTDEIFYLVWTRDPNAYALTYQPFGYLLHPLYRLVGGDLQEYRLAGFAIAAGAGAFAGWSLPRGRRTPATFALYGALSAFTIFFPWIITPSYNSAANVGALLIIGGVLNSFRSSPRAKVAAAVAAAAGLCIAAFSKPPLFAIAAAGIALVAILAKRARHPLVGALLLGAAAVTLFIPPAEVPRLVERITITQHVLSLPNTPLALPSKIARDWLAVPLPLTIALLGAASSFALGRRPASRWAGYAAIGFCLYYIAASIPDALDGSIPDFLGLSMLLIAASYAAIVHLGATGTGAASALLLAAPPTVALGTFNNQWSQLNFSMTFAFLALFLAASVDAARWRRSTAQIFSLIGPVAVLVLAFWAPYSLPAPIYAQQSPIEVPLSSGSVKVDEETADFFHGAEGLARGALLVDLSGTGPGVGAILGARIPVLPWLNPATRTWPDVVWSRLSAKERDSAWFVVPVWPQFTRSQPALWLVSQKARFCRLPLPQMFFWGEDRSLELWRPCRARIDPTSRFPARTHRT
jgi:hypothetical protein